MKLESSMLTIKYFRLVLFVLGLLTPNHQVGAIDVTSTTGSSITSKSSPTVSSPTVSSTPSVGPITMAPSPLSPPIVEVAKVSYRGSIVRIFADAGVSNHSRFFFDPLVQLDLKSITYHPHNVINNYYFVSFNIILWNPELRRQVFDRVKSLNGQHFNATKITEKDIHVLPFEEILLYSDRSAEGTYSWQFYNGEDEYVDFKIYCNSTNAANVLAEDIRRNPESVMYNSNMTCKGLNLGNQLVREITYTYPISTSNSTPTAPTTTAKALTTITMASTTTAPTPTPPSAPIVEVSKVSYRGSIIRIFADGGVKNHSRFFFEPLVKLDPKSIFAHHHSVLQSNVVSFSIEMWNPELRRKVLTRLQSLKGQHFNMTYIVEEDIYVLPFEEVLLIYDFVVITNPFTFTKDPAVVEIRDPLKSYVRQSENLQFYVLCNSTITANGLTGDFRRNPGFLMQKWNMTCSGLNLGNQLGKELKYTYPISISNSTSS